MDNKKILMFGLGKEGVSAANYLGAKNDITIYDDGPKSKIDPSYLKKLKDKNVKLYFQKLPDLRFDFVVRSPGVRPDHMHIKKLVSDGAVLTSPIKIFFDLCPAEIIGVTGTKGKGTTSTLIYEMLKTQHPTFLAGNIGTPALDILKEIKKDSLVVLELSSFQLFDLDKSPHVGVVLMITQEHLDWHMDLAEYRKAKEAIVSHQTKNDYAVINKDFEASKDFAKKTKGKVYFFSTKGKTNGAYASEGFLFSNIEKPEKILATADVLLPGKHNLQNITAATSVAKILGIKNENIKKVLKTFKGLIHRLQLIRDHNGVRYYNDSFATTPETTIAAIEAFQSPKILILGGSSKNSNFSDLGRTINKDESVKALILIGKEAERIKGSLDKAGGFNGKIIEGSKNMEQAVKTASSLATDGNVVLLSPACASFDMFKNYQDRGEQFIIEVKKLGRKRIGA